MADVQHVVHHETNEDRSDTSIAMLVFTLVAILLVAAIAFFAFNSSMFNSEKEPAGTSIDVKGTVDTPLVPSTNQGTTTNP
jgi:flagellar basal body-associated protein FliL